MIQSIFTLLGIVCGSILELNGISPLGYFLGFIIAIFGVVLDYVLEEQGE